MSNRFPGTQTSSLNDDDTLLVIIAAVAFPSLVAVAAQVWGRGATWLVQHQILVPASDRPLLPLPTMQGAGLDLARISMLVGVVVLAGVLTALGARSLMNRRIQ